ncbi:MAG: DEAD/DEAH box helicase, partial [Clostridia bacterium]|nr:DEAD/DEAH box helicase [Clostridia bacterium]
MQFNELNLIPRLLRAIDEVGYERPTPIQAQAIPPVLAGRDVLGCAQTGTGKTAAFAIPTLQRLFQESLPKGKRPIRALVVTPTRELALQIQENFAAYGKHLPLRSCVIFGGVSQKPQEEQLARGFDVLVATPGRLNDLIGQGLIDLSHIELFILDEADEMLDMADNLPAGAAWDILEKPPAEIDAFTSMAVRGRLGGKDLRNAQDLL